MSLHTKSKLDPKKHYLQVALNGSLEDAQAIIQSLPVSDRIIVEAGTPLIKRYGAEGIRKIRMWYQAHVWGINERETTVQPSLVEVFRMFRQGIQNPNANVIMPRPNGFTPYVVADMKTMDRGGTEVEIAARAGASAVIALGSAPTETLDAFIAQCEALGLDAMIDMMNVEFPLAVLRSLKKVPPVVLLHRGVDEEAFNREKQIPLHEIRRIKGNFNIMVSIAGGDTLREVQRSIFNDADIVVVWKSVYQKTAETAELVKGFLKEIK